MLTCLIEEKKIFNYLKFTTSKRIKNTHTSVCALYTVQAAHYQSRIRLIEVLEKEEESQLHFWTIKAGPLLAWTDNKKKHNLKCKCRHYRSGFQTLSRWWWESLLSNKKNCMYFHYVDFASWTSHWMKLVQVVQSHNDSLIVTY